MKSFTLFICAAIVTASSAINEPVASPTDSIERELAEYERQLGTDVTGAPTATPGRPTDGVSLLLHTSFYRPVVSSYGEPRLQCMVYTAVG